MYYFLRQNLFEENEVIEISGHSDETGQFIWTSGVKFDKPLPKQILMLDPEYGNVMADFFDTTVPVMSERLIRCLHELGVDNFDTYAISLERMDDKQRFEGYSAVNFLGAVDAVDLSNSEHRLRFGKPYFTGRIAIDPGKVNGLQAFRLQKGPGFLVVTERVAEALKARNFVAVLLQPTTDYAGT
jgi:hypothetical protein